MSDGIRSGVNVRVVVGCVGVTARGHCALLRGIVVSGMIVTGAVPATTETVTCRYKMSRSVQIHMQ